MVIGIDLSTTVAGIALIDDNKKIIEATAIDISKKISYDDKAELIIKQIDDYLLKYNDKVINNINIEEALKSFAFGKTNTLTLLSLIKNNAVISYILQKRYPNIKISLINMNTARKQLWGKCRIKSVKSKIFVKSMLESSHPDCINFYLPMNSIRCRNENSMNEDLRDAIVMALYSFK